MPETLKLRRVAIDTYHENVAYLHRACSTYRSEGFQSLSKVEVGRSEGRSVLAVLNVVDDPAITALDELGLSEQAFDQLGAPPGTPVRVAHARPPGSLAAVHRKIRGEHLDAEEYAAIAREIAANRSKTLLCSASRRARSRPAPWRRRPSCPMRPSTSITSRTERAGCASLLQASRASGAATACLTPPTGSAWRPCWRPPCRNQIGARSSHPGSRPVLESLSEFW